MLDDFVFRAALGGIGVALAAGPLGSLIVWRRMAYFGDTLSHSALLGVALGLIIGLQPILGVLATCIAVALLVVLLQAQVRFSTDTLLGILSHAALAIGLIAVGTLETVRVDLFSYLFGDILAVGTDDLIAIYLGAAAVLTAVLLLWRRLVAATVSEDLARAEGQNPLVVRIALMLMLAAVIAIAMRIVGVLLVTSMLIIPAAAARQFAATPEQMAVGASLLGVISVIAGLGGSLAFDSAAGPSIVAAAFLLFAGIQAGGLLFRGFSRS